MTKIIEINAASNEIIEREPTTAELEQAKLDAAEKQAIDAAKAAKVAAKSELLARLGITEDEAALLLG